MVVVSLSFYALFTRFFTNSFSWNYFVGAILIALISWLDDLYTISFGWRFLIHTVGALLAVIALGNYENLPHTFGELQDCGKIFCAILMIFGIVWLTNAYNFMDGIDGIAAIQATVAGIGWFLAGEILHLPGSGFFGGVLAAASFGFFLHNRQPAKIFMGDVGSAFLGYSFAVLPILAFKESKESTAADFGKLWIIGALLVWVFLFDTIFTFWRRVYKGEKVWRAHRSHIYQQLVINGFSHRFVALLYGTISALTAALVLGGAFLKLESNVFPYIFIATAAIGLLFFLNRPKKIEERQDSKK